MKRIGIFHMTALFLALGIAGPACGRQGKPDKQEDKAKPGKPEREAKPERQHEERSSKQGQEPQVKEKQDQRRDASSRQQQQDNSGTRQEQAKAQQDQREQERNSANRRQANIQQEEKRQQQQDKSNKHEQQIAKRQQDQEPRMIGRKAERGRINSDNSIRIVTTGQHNNGVHLKQIGSMLPGRVIAHVAGSPSTAAGSNGGVTTATESQMTVSVVTMAKIMGSASTVSPWCSLAAVSAFSTAVTGLAWLIRGLNTGQTIGMTAMTSTWTTTTTDIICTTADILATAFPSAST